MKNLTTGIYTLFNTANDFNTAIGGRLFKGRAPVGTVLPYAIFFVVSDAYDPTFNEDIEDVLIQFSLFSETSSSAEIEDMYIALKSLYDNTSFPVTGNIVINMQRLQATISCIEADAVSGSEAYWQYDVDYSCVMQKI